MKLVVCDRERLVGASGFQALECLVATRVLGASWLVAWGFLLANGLRVLFVMLLREFWLQVVPDFSAARCSGFFGCNGFGILGVGCYMLLVSVVFRIQCVRLFSGCCMSFCIVHMRLRSGSGCLGFQQT